MSHLEQYCCAGVAQVLPWFQERSWLYGLILAALVGVVIIGSIRRIGAVAEILVPAMCFSYILAALWIILGNFAEIPTAIATIIRESFAPAAIGGGFVGVLVQGVRRAAFDNEQLSGT